MELTPLLIMGAFAVFAVVSIYFTKMQERKRREAMFQAADEMGLTYREAGEELLHTFGTAKLLNRGRRRKISNVIEGQTDELSITIFDYYFTTGSGKRRRRHFQTVACLRSPELSLPQFTMRPQSAMFDSIGKTLGGQDIDFDSHPKFSQMFVLQGENEETIRYLFRDSVLQYFEQQKGISVESLSDGLLFYRRRRRVDPEGMRGLLSQAYEVHKVVF